MPDIRTVITEVVTGLGMTSYPKLETALKEGPHKNLVLNVDHREWENLHLAYVSREYDSVFQQSWENGKAFLASPSGLRGLHPKVIEWKGPTKPPGYDTIPMDLRIEHVYMVSCKYNSNILHNTSPMYVFDSLMNDKRPKTVDWYNQTAPLEHQAFYEASVAYLEINTLPRDVKDLSKVQRNKLAKLLRNPTQWPDYLKQSYREMCDEVADISAAWWQEKLDKSGKAEEMYWRIVRITNSPYFILGRHEKSPIRTRVLTSWDWKQRFDLKQFTIVPDKQAGQPVVVWQAIVKDKTTNLNAIIQGHIEIRWSHGKLGGPPEAKVYLDTPIHQIKGYLPLS